MFILHCRHHRRHLCRSRFHHHHVALKSDVPFLGWHCRRGFCLPKNEQTTDRPNERTTLRYMPAWKCLGLVHTQLVKT